MNDIFIMLTGTIARMGGAQMYVNNKASFMKKNGYQVFVFSGLLAPVLINGLKQYENTIIPELEKFPIVLPKREINNVLKRILCVIGNTKGSNVIIESNEAHMSIWAEMLAEKINARHYAFLLDESFSVDPGYIPFLKYKFDRNELLFISKDSPKLLFEKYYNTEPVEPVLSAFCSNVVEDVADRRFDEIDYGQYDIVTCHIGRLNKIYVPNVITGLKLFSQKHLDKKLAFIFIGDQPKDFIPDMNLVIKDELSVLENVDVYNMGYVYPIPESMFKHLTVNISTAGSARVSAVRDVLTINMDAKDGQPIGVFGYTTNNNLYRENEPIIPLAELLEDVCFGDYRNKHHNNGVEDINETALQKHINYLSTLNAPLSWFNVIDIKPQNRKNKIAKFTTTILGTKLSQSIYDVIKPRKK